MWWYFTWWTDIIPIFSIIEFNLSVIWVVPVVQHALIPLRNQGFPTALTSFVNKSNCDENTKNFDRTQTCMNIALIGYTSTCVIEKAKTRRPLERKQKERWKESHQSHSSWTFCEVSTWHAQMQRQISEHFESVAELHILAFDFSSLYTLSVRWIHLCEWFACKIAFCKNDAHKCKYATLRGEFICGGKWYG